MSEVWRVHVELGRDLGWSSLCAWDQFSLPAGEGEGGGGLLSWCCSGPGGGMQEGTLSLWGESRAWPCHE